MSGRTEAVAAIPPAEPVALKRDGILILLLVAVSALVMLPRLLSSNFGLLDDGVVIVNAREVLRHPPAAFHMTPTVGRFMPLYWLFNGLVYAIGGARPAVFFTANFILLATTALLLFCFLLWRGASRSQALAAGILFVLSPPVTESFYTLAKAEPLQVALLAAGLALAARTPLSKTALGRWVCVALMALAFLLAFCEKETSFAIIPIFGFWLFLRSRKGLGDRMGAQERAVMFVAALFAVAGFWMLRAMSGAVAISAGTYTRAYQFVPARILGMLPFWAVWLVRDFSGLLPLGIFVAWTLKRKDQSQTRLLGDAVIWMLGWLAIFLPWQGVLEYYLLPFSFGYAMFAGVAAGQLLEKIRLNPRSMWLWACAASIAVLLIIPQFNDWTAGRFQITVDAANADLVRFLSQLPKSSRIRINIPGPNEYEFEIALQLKELRGRSDLSVDYFQPTASHGNSREVVYIATPFLQNQLVPAPRLALSEAGAAIWRKGELALVGDRAVEVYRTRHSMPVIDVGLYRLICPVMGNRGYYCAVPRALVDMEPLKYGWIVDKVASGLVGGPG